MTRRILIASVLLLLTLLPSPQGLRATERGNPIADPQAIVPLGNVRFTVLTPQLIRLEWSATGRFEDRPSLVFINRRLPVPVFRTRTDGAWFTLETAKLTLRYRQGAGKFDSNNLEIVFDVADTKGRWRPGMPDTANLGGTIRTLDGVKGATALDPGILSRDGWAVVDDSNSPLFDESDWPWVMRREEGERQDLYFFGYGHEYKKALGDFIKVAGKIPLPPRYVFGLWWSRYWSYTDQELRDLVNQYRMFRIPLDVLVVDMDWHLTFDLRWHKDRRDQAGQRLGWTGYTWDRVLFPDPDGFLAWCKEQGLKVTLNLHPASGIQPHEEVYPAMAQAMGVDPASRRYIPFDLIDKKFARNYFEIVLRPLERQGVDFWWMDWQQWDTTRIPTLNPTWWINYTFFTDMERQGKQRPVILARWGGLGNHRYQVGFSGDVLSDWSSLAFQPYFTATAANVGFGYWSHDIGGHIPGPVSPELYTRWVQWGAFSPVLRTHTTKNPDAERRIWAYPYEYFDAMRRAVLLRSSLLPYIYTEARKTYDSGISLCRPLYYDYPEHDEAYEFKQQYQFGDALLVAPVVAPIMPETLLAAQRIWLPPGTWVEWSSGSVFSGPRVLDRMFALEEIPVYAKAGAIIPLREPAQDAAGQADPLILTIFPGDSGATRIYEDEGNSLGYQRDEYAWTPVSFRREGRTLSIRIDPTQGKYPGMLNKRAYEIHLFDFIPPESVTVNGKAFNSSRRAADATWGYDGNTLTVVIRVPKTDTRERTVVNVRFGEDSPTAAVQGVREKLTRLRRAMDLLNGLWPKDWSPSQLVEAVQTGERLSLDPKNYRHELERFKSLLKTLRRQVLQLEGDSTRIRRALNHLSGMME
jgi:alpha-glucosidase